MTTTVVLTRLKYKDHDIGDVTEVRFTNAPFDVIYDNKTWIAAGDLLRIGNQESSYELVTEGVLITLSGLNASLQPIIDRHGFRKAPVDILLGTLPDNTNVISAASYWHRGFALTPVTEFDESGETITVAFETESVFKDLSRTANLMSSSLAHHQALHPNDMFFQYTADVGLGEEAWKK